MQGWAFPSLDCVKESQSPIPGEVVYLHSDWCSQAQPTNVFYTPVNSETSDVVNILKQTCSRSINFYPKNDTEELQKDDVYSGTDIGLVFPDGLVPLQGSAGSIKNAVISYTIRMNTSSVPSTEKLLPAQILGEEEYTQIGPRSSK